MEKPKLMSQNSLNIKYFKGGKFMFNKKSLLVSLLLAFVLVTVITGSVFAEIEVMDNPTWPEEDLGPKPELMELKDKEVELDFQHFSTSQTVWLEVFAEEFNKLYPDIEIKINVTRMPYAQMYESLATSLMANSGQPDLVGMEFNQSSRFLKEPFVNFFKELNLSDKLKNNLIKTAPYTDSEGKLRAVPHAGPHPVFLLYRKDLFDKAGIEMPIETWDEFIEAGLKMKEELGIPIISFPMKNVSKGQNQLTMLAVQNGNSVYNEEGKFILNNEQGVEAFQLVKDMVFKHKIAADADSMEMLTQQRLTGAHPDPIASLVQPLWFFGSRLSDKIEEEGLFRIAPLPKFPNSPNRTSTFGGTGISILKSTEYPELTEAFLMYVSSDENQFRKFEAANFLPIKKSAYESDYFDGYKNEKLYGDQNVGAIFPEYTKQIPDLRVGEGWMNVRGEIKNRLNELENMDVQEWLDKIAEYQENL